MVAATNSLAERINDACQVLVVGGGPAGSAAANAAARMGLDVILIEAGSKGRDKACGDMFMPAATALLFTLGLNCDSLECAQEARSFSAVALRTPRGLLWEVRYPDERVWILPRRIVDQQLRDLLSPSVRVLYDTSALHVSHCPGGWLQVTARGERNRERKFDCRAVVLAGGARDCLSESWGISGRRVIAASISAYTSDPGVTLPAFEFLSACRPGYRWTFPMAGGGANIGVCALGRTQGSRLKSLGRDLCSDYGIPESGRWRGGAGGLWSGHGVSWHHSAGLVSCGDAAGLVDPINGEGITAALTSGLAAGEAAARFVLRNFDVRQLQNYSEWVRAYFTARYANSPVRTAWKQLCGIVPPSHFASV